MQNQKQTKDHAQKEPKDSTHNRDISSRTIFQNPILCAQFLRDHVDIPILRNVQPEDIEDVSERYRPYLGTEFQSNTVKRIRIHKEQEDGQAVPIFLISLIEHKSLVDYNVAMQLLKYMMCIWTEYGREADAMQEGASRRKGFRYPMIIPIVYYEGKAAWTAGRHLKERITMGDAFSKWIPDFQYEVVRVHDYSNEELLAREDEISLIMLINKIQDAADLENFKRLSAHQINRIIRESPGSVIDVIISVIESLCIKMGITAEETKQCVRKVRGREMGYLFENMENINIQEERRKVAEARAEAEMERKRAEKAQEEATKAQEELARVQKEVQAAQKRLREIRHETEENALKVLIESFRELGISKDIAYEKLSEKLYVGAHARLGDDSAGMEAELISKSRDDALSYMELYWK